ncbi:MAG: hypothetical protein ACRDNF_19175, partial [Streptosporangiaceae bacterium]
ALLFGGMGYWPPFPASWQAAAEVVLGDEARYLAEADLYILTPQMCDVVIAAAQSLAREDLELLDEDDLPGLTGLIVLPHPVIVRAIDGELGDLRAFSWRFPSPLVQPSADGRTMEDTPAVRVSSYHDSHGPIRPAAFLDFAARARAQGTPLPPLLLDAIRCLPLRYTATPDQVRALEEFVAVAQHAGDAARQPSAVLGVAADEVVGEYTPGSEIDDRDDSFMLLFLYAFWRLCEQRIAAVDHAEINHSAKVVAERAGVSPEVRIVQLRRTEQPGDPSQATHNWQHRWVVRMHKVHQWYPTLQQHKVIYRGPYIKGPDDKPLLGREIIRGLTR